MDFDVQGLSTGDCRNRVNRVLESRTFRQALALRDMSIEHVTESKQTPTTQRWKFGILTPAAPQPAPTRMEFSRRTVFHDAVLEGVDPRLLRALGLPAVLVSHYPAGPAWRQKVGALACRATPQARDIFDLHLLLASGACDPAAENRQLPPDLLEEAERRCLGVRFDAFKGQVLSYLDATQQATYDDPGLWDEIALKIAEALRGGHESG
jgi:hypothetical protein